MDFAIPRTPFGGTANFTFERVSSLRNDNKAYYFNFTGQLSSARGFSVGLPIYVGFDWGLDNSYEYSEWAFGISVPFKALPSSWQSKVWASLSNGLATFIKADELLASFATIGLPDFTAAFSDDLANNIAKLSANAMHFLDKCEATVFWGPGFSHVGVELSFNPFGGPDDGTTRISGNVSYAWQLWPSETVAF